MEMRLKSFQRCYSKWGGNGEGALSREPAEIGTSTYRTVLAFLRMNQ